VAGADDVPWDRVGDGWYLTAVDQGPRAGSGWIRPSHQLVQLVNPRGGRYTMWRNTVRHGRGLVRLVDWSADARVALLTSEVDMGHLRAIAVDLRTGERQQLVLPTSVAAVALRPGGAGVVATTYGDGDADSRELLSVDWTGAQRVVFRGLGGNALVSPDGSRVVTGPTTAQGSALRVIDTATGGVTDEIATPAGCDPYRWWAVDVVAARCWGEHQSLQVWTFPLDGSPATQLSTFHGRASEDLGDLDARVLGGRTYLQASGSCGYVFLARQEGDGSATTVDVPAAVGSVHLVDATDDALVLQHGAACGDGATRSMLSHFDPTTGVERSMARLPRGQEIARVLVYGERPVLGW
jgi:TolB protein